MKTKTAYENQLDKWGPPDLYRTVDDFLAHCQKVFGSQPTLLRDPHGEYIDDDGELVLMEVWDYDDHDPLWRS
jgi:hypothetical protein